MKADVQPVVDRGELVPRMEPMLLGATAVHRALSHDLAVEVAAASSGFRRSLPPGIGESLGHLVRSMNCYYSNLIEGHNTHPVDIERALVEDFSRDTRKRNLQLEARAHIEVQGWIDSGGAAGRAVSPECLREIHHRFCTKLPESMLEVEDPETGERLRLEPGELRRRDVRVGQHVTVSPGALPRFLEHFGRIYGRLGRMDAILAAAAAHHRLLWIHPFLEGNGRVARLMSHALLLESLESGGLWSVARGLARNVVEYKRHLAACDWPRRDDLDGRGNLSEQSLGEFTVFFLRTCLDQIHFMEGLVEPHRLRSRILEWAEEEVRSGRLPAKSGVMLEAVLYRGELPRSELAGISGTGDRQARRIVSALQKHGVLTSPSSRAPLRLVFPAALAGRWMPGLFPEQPD